MDPQPKTLPMHHTHEIYILVRYNESHWAWAVAFVHKKTLSMIISSVLSFSLSMYIKTMRYSLFQCICRLKKNVLSDLLAREALALLGSNIRYF
jgi:hypothetical protein